MCDLGRIIQVLGFFSSTKLAVLDICFMNVVDIGTLVLVRCWQLAEQFIFFVEGRGESAMCRSSVVGSLAPLCAVCGFYVFFCVSISRYSAFCVALKSQWELLVGGQFGHNDVTSEVIILWFVNFYLIFTSTFWYIILTPPKIQPCFLESTEVKGSLCIYLKSCKGVIRWCPQNSTSSCSVLEDRLVPVWK